MKSIQQGSTGIWDRLPETTLFGILCILGVAEAFASVALIRFGDWAYSEPRAKIALISFVASVGVPLSAILSALFLLVLNLLDSARARLGSKGMLVIFVLTSVLWLQAMVRMIPISVSSSVYANPAYAVSIVLAILLAAQVGRGTRDWRRADLWLLIAVLTLFALSVGWINVVALRKGEVVWGRFLNISIVASACLLAGSGCRIIGRQPQIPPARPSRLLQLFPIAAVAVAAAAAPLYRLARDTSRTPSVASGSDVAIRLGTSRSYAANQPRKTANVILISLDTLRPDHLGIYGYEKNTSPNIDAFFAQGSVFENSYAQAPWTLPSHASMFTGQYPTTHGSHVYPGDTGGYIDRLRPESVTVAEILREHGFATAAFTGGAFVSPAYGLDQGFDEFTVLVSARMEDALDVALPWIEDEKNRPFFLFLHSFDVHRYNPPRFFSDLSDHDYHGPLRDVLRSDPQLLENQIVSDGLRNPSRADVEFVKYLYDTEIRQTDAELERLFSTLERSSLIANTAVILTSDHGESFWEREVAGHGFTVSDPTIRVPLLISAPGYRSGRRISGLARVIDVPATVLSLVGASDGGRSHMQGSSLLEAMESGKSGVQVAITEADRFGTQASIITKGYKYVNHGILSHDLLEPRFALRSIRALTSRYNRGEELYALNTDPAEQRNLAKEDRIRAGAYRELLFSMLRSLPSPDEGNQNQDAEMTEELEQQLRALGYTE